ncbi:uncharacterized protein LOC123547372 isoform X8 [Mercenaria mercenaria]|uniref:uncharacterized protein LOC123547372 isoform X8 n=1 Tax=Mercenaria mercenaria TaxID=6596 RepID=UPI00234ED4E4|nr:uncharacterized protein LOC123547372 isoform X8 [Mercenaria mercenaria]
MESYLMMLYVTLEQESALKNFFVDQGWMFCKPDLSVTTDKLGPAVQNPPVVSEEISLPETDIPPQMKQTIPEIKINIPPSKPATGTSTVRRGKRKTKSPKQTAIRIKQAKVASASVPEPSESNENLVTEAVESNKSETLDTSKIKVPITVQVEDGNQFTIKIEQESEDVGNDKGEVDNSDVVGNDDFDDGDDDNDEETNVDYSFEGASTSEGDTSVKMESQSLGNNSTNVNTAAKGGSSGKHASEETENKENGWEYGYNYHGHEQLNFTSPADTSTEFTCLIEYFQELSEDQKRTVTGFLCVLGNALQACSIQRSTFASPSASTSSQQSSFASPMASTCKTNLNVLPEYEKKVPLIVDREDDKRFQDILVNPVSLRKAEQSALISKTPGLYLVNKVASLLFTTEEFQNAKGVSGLNSLKQEALLEYLHAKEKSLCIPPVNHTDYRRTLQNKITNARKYKKKTFTKLENVQNFGGVCARS